MQDTTELLKKLGQERYEASKISGEILKLTNHLNDFKIFEKLQQIHTVKDLRSANDAEEKTSIMLFLTKTANDLHENFTLSTISLTESKLIYTYIVSRFNFILLLVNKLASNLENNNVLDFLYECLYSQVTSLKTFLTGLNSFHIELNKFSASKNYSAVIEHFNKLLSEIKSAEQKTKQGETEKKSTIMMLEKTLPQKQKSIKIVDAKDFKSITEATSIDFFQQLPKEITKTILEKLDRKSLGSISVSNKDLQKTSNSRLTELKANLQEPIKKFVDQLSLPLQETILYYARLYQLNLNNTNGAFIAILAMQPNVEIIKFLIKNYHAEFNYHYIKQTIDNISNSGKIPFPVLQMSIVVHHITQYNLFDDSCDFDDAKFKIFMALSAYFVRFKSLTLPGTNPSPLAISMQHNWFDLAEIFLADPNYHALYKNKSVSDEIFYAIEKQKPHILKIVLKNLYNFKNLVFENINMAELTATLGRSITSLHYAFYCACRLTDENDIAVNDDAISNIYILIEYAIKLLPTKPNALCFLDETLALLLATKYNTPLVKNLSDFSLQKQQQVSEKIKSLAIYFICKALCIGYDEELKELNLSENIKLILQPLNNQKSDNIQNGLYQECLAKLKEDKDFQNPPNEERFKKILKDLLSNENFLNEEKESTNENRLNLN